MKVRSEIPTAENTTNMDGFGTAKSAPRSRT